MFHRIVTGLAFSFSFRHPRGLLSACWALTVAIRLCLPAGAFAQSSLLATATELDVMRIAGTPEGSGSADGVGRSALFRSPAGIWGDGANLYVCDRGTTIRRVEPATGRVSTFAGRPNALGHSDGAGTDARVSQPVGIWGDTTSLFVIDGFTVRRIDIATQVVSTLVSSIPYEGVWPGPVAAISGDSTNIYVLDRRSIRVITRSTGEIALLAGSLAESGYADGIGPGARFSFLRSVWREGRTLFALETVDDEQRIRQINLDTREVTTVATGPGYNGDGIRSMWSDGTTLFIPDPDRRVIDRLDLRTFQFGTSLNVRANGIWGPPGQGSQLFFTDATSNTIGILDIPTGTVTVLAGGGSHADWRFFASDIWSDGENLFFSDFSSMIWKLSLATGVTSVAANVPDANSFLWGKGNQLFVASGRSISRIDLTTGAVRTLTTFPFRPAFHIAGIWGDETTLYVPDEVGGAIAKVDQTTGEQTYLLPRGVGGRGGIWGANGSLFIGASSGGCIVRIDIQSGAKSTLPACPGGWGLWGEGSLLFAATGTTVVRINLDDGSVTTIAGSPGFFGSEDGRGSAARFTAATRVMSDGASLYVIDGPSLRKLVPAASTVQTHGTGFAFDLNAKSGVSFAGAGRAATVIGYAVPETSAGNIRAGEAVLALRQNNVLIHESAIPLSEAVRSGRVPIKVEGSATTGIAIANANAAPATIRFFFTDKDGIDFNAGSFTIGGEEQIARFVDQPPFSIGGAGRPLSGARTLTFEASLPVGVTAVRGYVNERSEFLTSTLPVAQTVASSTDPVVFPHFAQGDGWSTEIILVNPTDQTLTGSLQFFDPGPPDTVTVRSGVAFKGGGQLVAVTIDGITQSTFPYAIPARSSRSFQLSGSPATILRGSAQALPQNGGASPAGALLFSYRTNGVLVTEASILAATGTVIQLYGEADGPGYPEVLSLSTALAIVNPSATVAANVEIEFLTLDGNGTGNRALNFLLPPRKQMARFVTQFLVVDPFPLSRPLRGLIRITSSSPVSVCGFRARYNERGDFLFTATPSFAETAPASSTRMLIPHFADGGEYSTRFILLGDPQQPSSGRLSFYDQTGQPLDVKFQN